MCVIEDSAARKPKKYININNLGSASLVCGVANWRHLENSGPNCRCNLTDELSDHDNIDYKD
jgi:hypothetical protein